MASCARRVVDAFRAFAGRPPEGLWWAPGRVNLIGEHTDYNEGFVLPFALPLGTFAAAARRTDGKLRRLSLEEGESGPWTAYVDGVARALGESGNDVGGADVVVGSTVPREAGLSSSAALTCSVALALTELGRASIGRVELARVAQRAENEAVGVPTGLMDQLAALLARAGHALFVDLRSLRLEHVPFDVSAHGLIVAVVDTRTPRRLAAGAYARRRAECEEAARVLGLSSLRDAGPDGVEAAAERLGDVGHRRARHVVTENARVHETVEALRAGRFARVGELLDRSHRSLRDDFEVSSPALDAAVEAAREAGALGARLVGGGFGGSAIALAPVDAVDAIRARAETRFAKLGLARPHVFTVEAAGGACRAA